MVFLMLSKGKWLAHQTWHSLRLRGHFFRAKKRKFCFTGVSKYRKFTFLIYLYIRIEEGQEQYLEESCNWLVMRTRDLEEEAFSLQVAPRAALGSGDPLWWPDWPGHWECHLGPDRCPLAWFSLIRNPIVLYVLMLSSPEIMKKIYLSGYC